MYGARVNLIGVRASNAASSRRRDFSIHASARNVGVRANIDTKKEGWRCASPTRSITLKIAKEDPQQ
jgi:hypothetical protein